MLGFSTPGRASLADDNVTLPSAFNFPEYVAVSTIAVADNGSQYQYDGYKWKLNAKGYSYKGAVLENVSNATTIELSSGNFFSLNLSDNTTISFTNPPSTENAQKFQILLKASETISIVWPASVLWSSNSTPSEPASGQTDILEFYTSDGGNTYYGKLKEDNIS
jgi:hypothetical protein